MIKQTFTVDEFVREFKTGKTSTFEELKSGRLLSYKVGRRRYISGHAALAWQQSLERQDIESKLVVTA